jgi:hypothetical protein
VSGKGMKDPSRQDAAAEVVRELLAEAELDRLAALPPEQLRKELDDAGIPPGWGQNILKEAVARVDAGDFEGVGDLEDDDGPAVAPPVAQPIGPKSNVVSLDERRRARGRLLYAFAVAAVVLLFVGAWRTRLGDQIEAWFSPKPPAPIPTQPPIVPPPHEETPKEKADRLRQEAFVDVKKWYFDEAGDKLQDAKELDPAGDADPAVQQAYKDIAAGIPKPLKNLAKPPVGDGERPLQKR